MGGSKFQYDESGGTFFYFLTSFLALVLVPATYYWWPRSGDKKERERDRTICHCERCALKKSLMKQAEPWRNTKRNIIKITIVIGWLLLAFFAYKCAHVEHDQVNWDPFEILEIDPDATTADIKKAYRRMSLLNHPDKGGDHDKFMMISKAYAALTDEESRKNWEMYGNPDGPGATSFGIALPEWIVKKENSLIVLGVYALIFMIALPTVVGIWWYKSIKFGGDQVLLDTTHLYYYFINKTPHMVLKRVLMVVGASFEFEKAHNSEITERPSDNEQMNYLLKELPNLNSNNKERPLCFPYSIKARALLHAHLSRMELPPKTLDIDRMYLVGKFPNLIHEFVNCASQLTMLALAGRMARCPSLETVESAMKLAPLVIQALWESKSPLLQLPHITEDMLRRFTHKKRVVRSLREFNELKDDERRSMLRHLTPYQYEDIMNVLSKMPLLEMETRTEVLDDEDSLTITAGAIVTVFVTLKRKSLGSVSGAERDPSLVGLTNGEIEGGDEGLGDNDENKAPDAGEKKSKPVWEKQSKKGKGGKGGKKKKSQAPFFKKSSNKTLAVKDDEQQQQQEEGEDRDESPVQRAEENGDAEGGSDSESVSAADVVEAGPAQSKEKGDKSDGEEETEQDQEEEDDQEWEKVQKKVMKKDKKALEAKSRISHPVHCPYFPHEKHEYWWVYLSERKKRNLVTFPYLVTNLVESEEVELKFTAPAKPGTYTYCVCVRSDSYVDFDIMKNIKMDVKEAKKVEYIPQWDMSDEEEDEEQDEDSAVEDPDLLDTEEEDEGLAGSDSPPPLTDSERE